MNVKPIRPNEIQDARVIPDIVIETVNELLIKHYSGRTIIYQQWIVDELVRKGVNRKLIFENRYLQKH